MTDSNLSIDQFQVLSGEGDAVTILAYENGEILRQLEDSAAIMVRLDLDGMTDEVTLDAGQSNDLHALTRHATHSPRSSSASSASTPRRLGPVVAWSTAGGADASQRTVTPGLARCPRRRTGAA